MHTHTHTHTYIYVHTHVHRQIYAVLVMHQYEILLIFQLTDIVFPIPIADPISTYLPNLLTTGITML